jgi:hypothetical protein
VTTRLVRTPFQQDLWTWTPAAPSATTFLGRECVRVDDARGTLAGVELVDGAIEVELAVGPERAFPGVFWRGRDAENFESLFVRPHQVGNPDAVQYTPVFNGISSWQLYHGPGFWAPVAFPIGEWFGLRVVFAGRRAEVYVGDLDEPALVAALKGPVEPGAVGIAGGGGTAYATGLSWDDAPVVFRSVEPQPPAAEPGILPAWQVSDAFPEAELDLALVADREWTRLESEPSGLADLSRVNGIRDGRNTVFARAVVRSPRDEVRALDLGFSDRAVVFLNGRPLFRGDDTYRTRDYRFLGSIGYWDTLYLSLAAGDNELVVAVSEDFGGWGVQARFRDYAGLVFV